MVFDHALRMETIFGASDFGIDQGERRAEIFARVVAFVLDCGNLLFGSHRWALFCFSGCSRLS